ncbi:hypothetical protein [Lysobacter enzymogenes]|uniref:hypothetical protein n=1 Tax=Lysobacter enzymogenes TaxID=69 RepID=UPI001A95F6D8|nr:hypothetical protein [Lysobacter enzymogenes]QQP97602.1 hypothetical protein JHW38_06170 [Lysobacter enzymogenes]
MQVAQRHPFEGLLDPEPPEFALMAKEVQFAAQMVRRAPHGMQEGGRVNEAILAGQTLVSNPDLDAAQAVLTLADNDRELALVSHLHCRRLGLKVDSSHPPGDGLARRRRFHQSRVAISSS